MTEPTFERPSGIYWDLEYMTTVVVGYAVMGRDDAIRDMLRGRLSSAWHEGWLAGFHDNPDEGPPTPNPFHEADEEPAGEAGRPAE
jgi:hypothetical protein